MVPRVPFFRIMLRLCPLWRSPLASHHRPLFVFVTLAVLFILVAIRERRLSTTDAHDVVASNFDVIDEASRAATHESSMEDVLELARQSLESMRQNVSDYTCRFVKHEQDASGNLGEKTEMNMKVMPRHRDGKLDAPMRVYLEFVQPESQRGREVIWAEDMHDAQLVVHEAGWMGILTVHLDPNGLIAMQGQRFPISQIGLTRLVELLIERGTEDLKSPDITVTITPGFEIDDTEAELIQVRRSKPSGKPNDFSLAEIVIDRQRMLILQYRSFGWPSDGAATPATADSAPLIESYTYHDIRTNVGLGAIDFDPKNPEYRFP